MTTNTSMITDALLGEAARTAVVEVLLNPEYGDDWLREILTSVGVTDATEEDLTRFNAVVDEAFATALTLYRSSF